MSHPIELAVALLQDEVTTLGTPKEHTIAWFTLRAKSHGLSLLRAMLKKGYHESPEAAETFRKGLRQNIMDQPPA